MKRNHNLIRIFIGLTAGLIFLCIVTLLSPSLRARLDQFRIRAFYFLNPPEEQVFTPNQQDQLDQIVSATFTALVPQVGAANLPQPTPSLTPQPIATLPPDAPTPTAPLPTASPTPLPAAASIQNVPYVDQHYGQNECAPASLAMLIGFWGWEGKPESVSAYVKPFERDKNVMPYELVDYVNTQTSLRSLSRIGGTPELLKTLVAAGYPVLVERGVYLRDLSGKVSWMGHYQVVYGYDEANQTYQVKDAFEENGAAFTVSYDDLLQGWRSFNYAFIVAYPPDQQAAVFQLLGPYADDTAASRIAFNLASQDTSATKGQDQFFSWYNRGSSQVALQDYAGAAQSYDQAFAVYADLPAANRPWRATWYMTGPYFAYYYAGRYSDVLALSDQTIKNASDPFLEENFYWRAMAKIALGDTPGAIEDLRQSLAYHPDFTPSVTLLQSLGATP